jgi:hypothetical protein
LQLLKEEHKGSHQGKLGKIETRSKLDGIFPEYLAGAKEFRLSDEQKVERDAGAQAHKRIASRAERRWTRHGRKPPT